MSPTTNLRREIHYDTNLIRMTPNKTPDQSNNNNNKQNDNNNNNNNTQDTLDVRRTLSFEEKQKYNDKLFEQWTQVFENLNGFNVNKPWIVVLYRHDIDDHAVLYSLTHCDKNQTVTVEPAQTTFTYQAEHSVVWDLTSSEINDDTGNRGGNSNNNNKHHPRGYANHEWLCMVQSEISSFVLRRLSMDLIDYNARHYRRTLSLDQSRQLQNNIMNYKNKRWNVTQRKGAGNNTNGSSSNLLENKQMVFINLETKQAFSPTIRSGEFSIPNNKRLILLRQIMYNYLDANMLIKIVTNGHEEANITDNISGNTIASS